MPNYLPSNSTKLEKAFEKAIDRALLVELHKLKNPNETPAQLLNELAREMSVDHWDNQWSENQKREIIKKSFSVHSKKGTKDAIAKCVSAFNLIAKIEEWFETNSNQGTFKLTILDSENAEINIFESSKINKLKKLIDDSKRKSQHYTLSLGKSSKGTPNIFGATIKRDVYFSKQIPKKFISNSIPKIYGLVSISIKR